MANNKKYVSLSRLSKFLDNLKDTFSALSHEHTVSEITDYTVDTELSPTSTNPVQNKVLDAEFEAISQALNIYDQALNDKADAIHTHAELSYMDGVTSNVQTQLDAKLPLAGGTMTGALELAADPTINMHAATKRYVDNEIENIHIGGRNLIAGTDDTTEFSGVAAEGSTRDVWTGTTISAPMGTEYVVSFDAKANVAMQISCYFYSPNTTLTSESSSGIKRTDVVDGTSQLDVTTEWKRYWVKWTQTPTDTVKRIIVGRNSSTSRLYIRAVKLEEGNMPSAWTPAPEDMAKKEDVPSTTENWTFTLEDGSTVTKAVYVG